MPWEGLPYERGGDARRLAQGCKFLILLSFKGLIQNFQQASPLSYISTPPSPGENAIVKMMAPKSGNISYHSENIGVADLTHAENTDLNLD